jgi:hypothetical protein
VGDITPESFGTIQFERNTGGDPDETRPGRSQMSHLNDQLRALHEHYVEAVNLAVAEDDLIRVDQLTAEYDVEALELMRATLTPAA